MPNYVENGYSIGYVEGDSLPSALPSVDLTSVLAELSLIKQQNIDLNTKLDTVLDVISTNKTVMLINSSKLVTLSEDIANINTVLLSNNLSVVDAISSIPFPDLSSLVTKDYIDSSVPFVDDMNVKVFRAGTQVTVTDYSGFGTVVSSHLLPIDQFDYTVVYSVEFIVDGIANVSNFLAQQVVLYVTS